MTTEIKKRLFEACLDYVQQRIDAAKLAIEDAQAAAEDETKSSAGDKYETGREMMQQEKDRNMAQLNEANKLKVQLSQVKIDSISKTAETGSLVVTDNGRFYIAISAGVIKLDNESYYAVSPASPVGLKLKGLTVGNKFSLNEKSYIVKEVI